MRRVLRRKVVMIIAAVISFTVIPAAGIVATATPALANVNICNSFGAGYCVGAPDLSYGLPVILEVAGTTGTAIHLQRQSWTCCNGSYVYQLQFASDTARCVGVAVDSNEVTVRECSGGDKTNTNWAFEWQSNLTVKWYNTSKNVFLGSDNTLYDQLFVKSSCTGCYFAWND